MPAAPPAVPRSSAGSSGPAGAGSPAPGPGDALADVHRLTEAVRHPDLYRLAPAELEQALNAPGERRLTALEALPGIKIAVLHNWPQRTALAGGDDVAVAWPENGEVKSQRIGLYQPFFVTDARIFRQGAVTVLAFLGGSSPAGQEPEYQVQLFELTGGAWRPAARIGETAGFGYLQAFTEGGGSRLMVRLADRFWGYRKSMAVLDPDTGEIRFCEGPTRIRASEWQCLVTRFKDGRFRPEPMSSPTLVARPPALSQQAAGQLTAGMPDGSPGSVAVLWSADGEAMAVTQKGLRLFFSQDGQGWRLSDWETAPGTWVKGNPLLLTARDASVAGVQIGDSEQQAVAALGWPDTMVASEAGISDWGYRALGLTLRVGLDEGRVRMLRLESGTGSTRRGLKPGDSPERMRLLYGPVEVVAGRPAYSRIAAADQPFEIRLTDGLRTMSQITVAKVPGRP